MDSAAARRVGMAFEAMLLTQVLRPLSHCEGAVESYGVEAAARAIAERDRAGFGAIIARRLADAS